MNKIGDNWEDFLLRNHFQELEETSSKEENVRRSKRRKIGNAIENKHDTSSQEESEELISESWQKLGNRLGSREKRR